jgi:co-chaperonin GroES (HSP10)
MTIKPVGKKLLVKELPKRETKLASGLIAPETVNADLSEGEVVAVSDELKGVIEIGDVLLFPKKKGIGQIDGSEMYLWLDATPAKEEVWGKVN